MRSWILDVVTIAAFGGVGGADAMPQQQDVTEAFSSEYQACITYGEVHDRPAIPASECNAQELRRQDARLNAAYKAVMARLPLARKFDLRTDERKWIMTRYQKCRNLPNAQVEVECVIDHTIKRTASVRRFR